MVYRLLILLICIFILFGNNAIQAQKSLPIILAPSITLVPEDDISSLVWCPDGTCFVAGTDIHSRDVIRIFDSSNAELIGTMSVNTLEHYNSFLVFSPDGTKLLAGAWNGLFTVWDFASRSLLIAVEDCNPTLFNLSQNGIRLLLNCSKQRVSEIWDLGSNEKVLSLPGHANWLHDEKHLIRYVENETYVYIYDATTGQEIDKLDVESDIVNIQVSFVDNRILIYGDVLTIWNMDTQQKSFSFPYDKDLYWLASWNDDSSKITIWENTSVSVWDTLTGGILSEIVFPDTTESYGGGGWNDEETLIMSGFRQPAGCSEDCSYGTYIWDGVSGKLLTRYDTQIAFPASTWRSRHAQIVSQIDDENLVIWDAITGLPLYDLPHLEAGTMANIDLDNLVFNREGTRLITLTYAHLFI